MFARPSVLALPHYFLFLLSSSSSPSLASSHEVYGDGPAAAAATTYDVDVGNGGLVFSPDSLIASVGDTINFHFYPRNHSVVQSRFDSPCVPLGSNNNNSSSSTSAPAAAAAAAAAVAIYSDFIPTSQGEADTMFSIVVNTTDPIWLYCSQGQHCQSGMTMVINAPTSGPKTLAAYREAAAGVQTAQSPDTGVAAGIIMPKSSGTGQGNRNSTSSSSSTGTSTGGGNGNSTTANSTATSTWSSTLSSALYSSTSSSSASASAAAATSVTVSTGAAPLSCLRPVAGMVVMGMLTVGLGM